MTKFLKLLDKIKPEHIFLVLGTFFGLIFLLITPVLQVPDEAMHLLRACEVSDFIIHNNKDGDITKDIFPNRKNIVKDDYSIFNQFKAQKHYTELLEFKDISYTHNNSGYPFLIYLPSAIGLKAASLITSNPYIIFYSGRILNLIFWLFLTFSAIRITPCFKWTFLLCALYPMTVYEGMSLSSDSINLGIAFFYIAYTYYLAYGKKDKITNKEFYFYIFLSFLTVLTKGLFLLTFLTLLIPKQKLRNNFFHPAFVILPVIIFQVVLSANSYILIGDNIDTEVRKTLIFENPGYVAKLFINTLIQKSTFYVQSSIFRLGWLEIEPNPFAVISLFICYLLSTVIEEIKDIKLFDMLVSVTLSLVFVLLTILLYFVTYSPLENNLIIGVQGRYFIPLYLVLILFFKKVLKLVNIKIPAVKAILLLTIVINLFYAAFLIIRA